ncbi:MAG TPA: hypothetical protein PKK84_03045 [Armatimonadota bacterium]|nr:hypothetical protein [Armatimonadota bacterium]
MKGLNSRFALIALSAGLAVLLQFVTPAYAAPLPSSVQFKVDKCIEVLNDAASELDARNPHMAREPLRVAKDRLNSIKEYQSENWDHPDVVAARTRYEALEKRYEEAQAKQDASKGDAEDQLKRLAAFRQLSTSLTYPEDIVTSIETWKGAKALIDEIAESGTDVQLQGHSDYSMTKMNVEVWAKNRDRVIQNFIDTGNQYAQKNTFRETEWMQKADTRLADIAKVLPADDSRLASAKASVAAMRTTIRQEQQERAAKVFMTPDRYKGKDAAALRALANKAVATKFPKARILKTNLTSTAWGPPEGGLQWTDNTRSAVEVRTTMYFKAEIAAKEGADVMLHRVYLYKEKVNGKLQPAKSYVVGSQLMLEKNVK